MKTLTLFAIFLLSTTASAAPDAAAPLKPVVPAATPATPAAPSTSATPATPTAPVVVSVLGSEEVCFSPKGGCTDMIIKTILAAKKSIYVQAYSFTSAPIVRALIAASARKVKVSILVDKSNVSTIEPTCVGRDRTAMSLLPGTKVWYAVDKAHAIAHNKIMIMDENTVLTGSFNFSGAAESSNAENMIRLIGAPRAKLYLDNWKVHQKHAIECHPPTN